MTATTIIDNVFSEEVLLELEEIIYNDCKYGWRANKMSSTAIFHSHYVTSPEDGISHYYSENLLKFTYNDFLNSEQTQPLLKEIILHLKNNFFKANKLSRVYANIQFFGQETAIHRDYPIEYSESAKTLVLYLSDLNVDDGGDVVIFDDKDEIETAIRIKRGRAIVFNGTKKHGVRPMSKNVTNPRIALVLGTERDE